MSSETEQAKWIRLVKQVQDTPTQKTDWKGISEATQIAMYATTAMFAGMIITGLSGNKKSEQETKSGSTSRTAKEKAI